MFRRAGIATLIAAFTLATTPTYACTGISLTAKDGAAIRGRTMEFGFPLSSNVIVIPAGTEMSGTLPDGAKASPTRQNTAWPESTQWTTVSDMKNLRWYFRTYDDETIRVVDLRKAVDAAKGQIHTIKMESKQPIVDASTTFMSGKQASDLMQGTPAAE
jgi:penicillin V acylase-like amidase (Ntn superfamily)